MFLREPNNNYGRLKVQVALGSLLFFVGNIMSPIMMIVQGYMVILIVLLIERWISERTYPYYYLNKEDTLKSIQQGKADFSNSWYTSQINPVYGEDKAVVNRHRCAAEEKGHRGARSKKKNRTDY